MKPSVYLLAPLLAFGLLGCSHKTENALNDKVQNEPPVSGRAELAAKTTNLIESTPGLTLDQRYQLTSLRNESQKQIKDLNETSLKLRSILYKDLVAEKINHKEIRMIKSRIKSVEKQKTARLLDAIEKATLILGKVPSRSDQQMEDFYFFLGSDPLYRL